jgi:hypothetical protein
VHPERGPHLEAHDVGRLGGLLRRHPELDDVEEELEQELVLDVAALHSQRRGRGAVLERERRAQGHRGRLPGSITL